MIYKIICILSLSIIISNSANSSEINIAFSCDRFEEWTSSVKNELNLGSSRRIKNKQIERYVYNLFSDKYFPKVFKKQFSESGKLKLGRMYNYTIKSCSHQDPGKYLIRSIIRGGTTFGSSREKETYQIALQKVEEINRLRDELKMLDLQLRENNPQLSYKELIALEYRLSTELIILLPNELNSVRTQLLALKSNSANIALNQKLAIEFKREKSLNQLKKIKNFNSINRELYKLISLEEKGLIDEKLNVKSNEIINELMTKEKFKLNNLLISSATISTINSDYNEFKKQYDPYSNYGVVKKTMLLFHQKKTEIINEQFPTISKIISDAQSLSQVQNLSVKYLKNVDPNNQGVIKIERLIDARTIAINNEIRRKEELRIAKVKKENAELKRIAKLNASKTYNRMIKRSSQKISSSELQTIINDLDNNSETIKRYSINDMNTALLLTKYLGNIKSNPLFIYDRIKKDDYEITDIEQTKDNIILDVGQSYSSFYDTQSNKITFNFKTKVHQTVNSAAWRIAQRCASVKRLLNQINTAHFKVSDVLVHEKLGIPIVWVTSLTESRCGLTEVYDNCNTPCRTRLNVGSENYSIILTDELTQYFHN